MIYLDTSLLLSTFVVYDHSKRAHAWLNRTTEPLMISALARLEFADVLSRAVRRGRFDGAEFGQLLQNFDSFCARNTERSHRPEDFRDAEGFVRDLATKLSAADALHLASARNAGAALATFDVRLADAAKAAMVEVRTTD